MLARNFNIRFRNQIQLNLSSFKRQFNTSRSYSNTLNDSNKFNPPLSKSNFNSKLHIALGFTLLSSIGYYFYQIQFNDPRLIKENNEIIDKKERKQRILEHLKGVEPISYEQVNLLLSNQQKEKIMNWPKGQYIIDGIKVYSNQLASNDPIEDRFFISNEVEKDQFIVGVFDGHSGFNCSEFLSSELPKSYIDKVVPIIHNLGLDQSKDMVKVVQIKQIQQTIKDTFTELDNYLLNLPKTKGKSLKPNDLLPAVNGSCAILASVDLNQGHIFVANTGDCRAVMGRLDERGHWHSVPLSMDHTLENQNEFNRVLREHPGEEDTVIKRKRILGHLQPSRAFGDARYKWDIETIENVYQKLIPNYKPTPKNYLSPPYVTAEPEVFYYHMDPRKDKFLILATDGLFDELTSQQTVELVGEHLSSPPNPEDTKVFRKKQDKIYAFEDPNIATHLIRNALGAYPLTDNDGNKDSMPPIIKLLSLKPPKSRRYRDDITVLVLLFQSDK